MSDLEAMIALAAEIRLRAYAPYSDFKVGACLRAPSGRLYAGCNVENVAYPEGLCAEANAIGSLIAAGETAIAEVVVLAEGDTLCTPCGACRQRLAEFAAPATPVRVCDPAGVRASFTLGALLPHAFDVARGGA